MIPLSFWMATASPAGEYTVIFILMVDSLGKVIWAGVGGGGVIPLKICTQYCCTLLHFIKGAHWLKGVNFVEIFSKSPPDERLKKKLNNAVI